MPKFVENIEEILPSCWDNDQRMAVLFAPFRPRILNPENYDSKMKFWQQLIEAYCVRKGEPCFNVTEVLENFKRKTLKAECLETVLETLIQDYTVRERQEFEQDPLNTWLMWAINRAIRRPLYCMLDILKRVIGLTNEDTWQQVQYVHLTVLQKFCEILIENVLEKQTCEVLLYSEFKNQTDAALPALTDEGLNICLQQLKCQGLIGEEILFQGTDDETKVIKIQMDKKGTCLKELDRLRILWKIEDIKLQEQAQEMQKQSDEVQKYLKMNNREIAKVHLRKKKMLEMKFEKMCKILHNIETLISSLEDTKSHGVILEAYKISAKALKDAHNIENVEEIIADMQDAISDHKEIGNIISNANAEMSGSDAETQLEAELNEMLNADKKVEKSEERKCYVPAELEDTELLKMLDQLEVTDDALLVKKTETEQKLAI